MINTDTLYKGIEGIPIPYTAKLDDVITGILLFFFVVSAMILAFNKRILWQQCRNFLLHKERSSIFVSSTSIDTYALLLLALQTCVFGSIFLLNYFDHADPSLYQQVSPHLALVFYTGACLLVLLFKWLAYSLIGWIFSYNGQTSLWIDSYFTLIYYIGFILFPFILLLIYFDSNLTYIVTIGLSVLIFAKLMIFYKWLKFFFTDFHGLFLLILYFCALEIMPCFIFYKGVNSINILLTKI